MCYMHGYKDRQLEKALSNRLNNMPAVALLGARQVGKSTLAKKIIQQYPDAIYLDLEKPSHLIQLNDPEIFFNQFSNQLICLDEVQRKPDIFKVLRSIIDTRNKNAQFLLLGSASRDLIKQSSESLAGRLSYMEITPFTCLEINDSDVINSTNKVHWLRGGYPKSYLASDNEISIIWREDYIQSYLERDIPQLGFDIPANTLGRLWRMLAHNHAQTLNSSKLADSMGVSANKIRQYIDLLAQTFVTRNLPPYSGNLKKRMIKSPKVYIRDSGLLHTLLGIDSHQDLFSHPVYGASFEGYIIENLLANLSRWQASFYRSSHGAEVDLILEKGQHKIAIEIKSSSAPVLQKGFWHAIKDIKPTQCFLVAPVESTYLIKNNVLVTSLNDLITKLKIL